MTRLDCWKYPFIISPLCAAVTASSAQIFTKMASFNDADGSYPAAALVQGLDGNLYGTTDFGGTGDHLCGYYGDKECGTVFKITRGGKLTTLLSFERSQGGNPLAGLVLTTDGDFYGTVAGGAEKCGYANECGTIFKVSSTGELTTLFSFCSQTDCMDGLYPYAGLVQAGDGNFYGTTLKGGASSCRYNENGDGCGTVFKMTPGGNLTTLYSFCAQSNCSDGANPAAGLIQGADGSFYGTTSIGGSHDGGTVFKITATGTLTTLYSFCSKWNCSDGATPYTSLVQAVDGNFYGTTIQGGIKACNYANGCGTVFKITPGGKLTTIYKFCHQSNCADGNAPQAALVQGTDGALYGTTSQGGIYSQNCNSFYNIGCGTAFKITRAGELTTLHDFCSDTNCSDGAVPVASLLQATDGNLYGTTAIGGGATSFSCPAIGCGAVFSLSTGLGPFVSLPRNSGEVGQVGDILGQGFRGTTGVFLNGTSASFTVVADTLIRATVPFGATTGFVTVQTPSVTLTSNTPFYVIP